MQNGTFLADLELEESEVSIQKSRKIDKESL
jgi:hypothetical protein